MNRKEQFALLETIRGGSAAGNLKMRRYCFKHFTVDASRRLLLNGKEPVRLNPKTFDLLLLLIEKSGQVVTKDEVLTAVWNDSFVEEGNIAVHISKLRGALGETKDSPFIQTVSGNGYCFVAPVKESSGSEDEENRDDLRFDSIVVLPLENETGDHSLEYLTDGLTDGFINSLSKIPDLRVVNRHTAFRYREHTDRLGEIGEELGVEAVLTGRVGIVNDRFVVGVELTECATNSQVWGDQLWGETTDIIELQRSILSRKTEALLEALRPAGKLRGPNLLTHDRESHRMYLKGRFFFEKRSIQAVYKSILFFERSVTHDPANVLSYTGMIEAYRLLFGLDELSFEEARNFIAPVVEVVTGLDSSSDSVQTVLGGLRMYFDWDFDRAEEHLLNALDSNPNNLDAHLRYSDLLLLQRRFTDARKEINNILLLDPVSPATFKRVGKAFYRMEQYQTAIQYLNEALEMNPDDYEALAVAAAVETETGRFESALERLNRSIEIERNPDMFSMVGYLFGKAGRIKEAKKELMGFGREHGDAHALKLARIHASIGAVDEAFACLERAFDQHDADLIGLNSDPRWSSISQDPRFVRLLQRIGLTRMKESALAI